MERKLIERLMISAAALTKRNQEKQYVDDACSAIPESAAGCGWAAVLLIIFLVSLLHGLLPALQLPELPV